MRLRLLLAPLGAVVTLAGLAAPSSGVNQTVQARPSNTFVPKFASLAPRQSVTFHNQGGDHGVAFDVGPVLRVPSTAAWTATRSFGSPGAYAYYCPIHGGRGGRGMSGVVFVAGPAPSIRSASLVGRFHGLSLTLRSSQTALVTGTISKRVSAGVFRVVGRLGGSVRGGVLARRLIRTSTAGRYRVVLRLRGGRLSAVRTLFASAS